MKSTLSMTAIEPMAMRPRGTRGLLATHPAPVAHQETSARFALGALAAGKAVRARDGYVAVPATPRAAAVKAVATANLPVRRSAPGRPPR